MATDITGTATWHATVSTPDDSDAASATAPGSPTPALQDVVQKLADRDEYLYMAIPEGAMVSSRRLSSTGGTNLVAGATMLVADGRFRNVAGATISPGTLAVDTWYYVYRDGAGNAWTVSTTAPDAALVTSAYGRYIGAFRTYDSGGGTAAILPFRMIDGRYQYRVSGLSDRTKFRAVNATSGGTSAQSLGAWMPPHARIARLHAVWDPGATTHSANVRAGTDTYPTRLWVPGAASQIIYDTFAIETDSSQQITWGLTTSGTLDLYVDGWEE